MFTPETEDMLPRAAPRPAAAVPMGHSEEIVKPTVPEISILFGQPPEQQQHNPQQPHLQQQQPPTFASWKKQLLPRVNFSPVLTTELGPASPPVPSPATGCNEYNYLPRSRAFESDRSMPPTQPLAVNSNLGYAVNVPPTYTRETFPPSRVQTVSHSQSIATDVLTICAGTQTDPEPTPSRRDSLPAMMGEMSNLANKHDLREVLTQLDVIRQEQQHLRHLCESLIQQQLQNGAKTFKETSSQCDILNAKSNTTVKRIMPQVHEYIVEEDERLTPYEVPHRAGAPQFQSPRAVPPMAQLAGCRTNTPQAKQSPAANSLVMNAVLQKPNTEKSLVMNELARKYLPQKQINELMDDLRLSPTTAVNGAAGNVAGSAGTDSTPLRRIDNFHQSPSNISNASYVYLKKYRLLPEQRMPYDQRAEMAKLHNSESPVAASPQGNEAMLDLDSIRNKPKLI
ncbi:hypothetical protein KR093_010359 [Drosophila rubida]|uniref:Uncharacterized protein n=1 Tax=Drosophila rubida TaxID=30044 RepID=A0AAD4PQQ1_9MUSC|nr:hypothetical protein KR093_010359 [Drosophila rubida]